MILAYAQHLYLQFGDDELAGLIKEASEKSVGSINYGSETECDQVLARIRRCTDTIESDADFADALQKRAKLISENAQFHADSDAVPVSATVATLFRIDDSGTSQESGMDLLGENYWRIVTTLSR